MGIKALATFNNSNTQEEAVPSDRFKFLSTDDMTPIGDEGEGEGEDKDEELFVLFASGSASKACASEERCLVDLVDISCMFVSFSKLVVQIKSNFK